MHLLTMSYQILSMANHSLEHWELGSEMLIIPVSPNLVYRDGGQSFQLRFRRAWDLSLRYATLRP
jgi:hypothetical protein